MQQTFFKNINGHKLEFNRMLYPVSYHIATKDIEIDGDTFSMEKDENGVWLFKHQDGLPLWLQEISLQIQEAIVENEETAEVNAP